MYAEYSRSLDATPRRARYPLILPERHASAEQKPVRVSQIRHQVVLRHELTIYHAFHVFRFLDTVQP